MTGTKITGKNLMRPQIMATSNKLLKEKPYEISNGLGNTGLDHHYGR